MKAVIFALIVLLGIDVALYQSAYVRTLGHNLAGFGGGIGAWVFSPG